jgi:coenzyme PQQ precursor peptide PqqA
MVASGLRRRFMKIMRRDSCRRACGGRGCGGSMGHGAPVPAVAVRRRATFKKETPMQWTTPTATDFRFGFEITMYVAAR